MGQAPLRDVLTLWPSFFPALGPLEDQAGICLLALSLAYISGDGLLIFDPLWRLSVLITHLSHKGVP